MFRFLAKLFGFSKDSPRIDGVQVLNVVDGDTVRVKIGDQEETLRLLAVDTEESQGNSGKPITKAGKLASEMAKKYFQTSDGEYCKITIEFDVNASLEDCLRLQRGTFGRLLCFVYKDGENYNEKLIREGYSPYFDKYGRSRKYHKTFRELQKSAQENKLVIWNPKTNEGGPSRDYETLLPWWESRGNRVHAFREKGKALGIYSLQFDYDEIHSKLGSSEKIRIFVDLQHGISGKAGDGAYIRLHRDNAPFSIWIPNVKSHTSKEVLALIEDTYAGRGIGYAVLEGNITTFKEKPQMVVENVQQFLDVLG